MQSLDVISINIWSIVIALLNLTILFLALKKFLYKPVLNMLDAREQKAKAEYDKAKEARENAEKQENEWNEKMKSADAEAQKIVDTAAENAKILSGKLEADAKANAERIVAAAETDAKLEYKRARDSIRGEIVDVSAAIAERVLESEIDEDEHHRLVNAFLDKIGDSDEGNS
jgi:F-type H+-transporting ATPase subunit b